MEIVNYLADGAVTVIVWAVIVWAALIGIIVALSIIDAVVRVMTESLALSAVLLLTVTIYLCVI